MIDQGFGDVVALGLSGFFGGVHQCSFALRGLGFEVDAEGFHAAAMEENEEGFVEVVGDGVVDEGPVVCVDDVGVCAAFHQVFGYGSTVLPHCDSERCVGSGCIDVCANFKEGLNGLAVSCFDGKVEGCFLTCSSGGLDVGVSVLELANGRCASTFSLMLAGCRMHHWCEAVLASLSNIDAGIKHAL